MRRNTDRGGPTIEDTSDATEFPETTSRDAMHSWRVRKATKGDLVRERPGLARDGMNTVE